MTSVTAEAIPTPARFGIAARLAMVRAGCTALEAKQQAVEDEFCALAAELESITEEIDARDVDRAPLPRGDW